VNTEIIVINNFYNDFSAVREMALGMNFNIEGNYPGLRTVPNFTQSAKDTIQKIIYPHAGKVTDWLDNNPGTYSGSFQLCFETDITWIHADIHNMWSGICYLFPKPPVQTGTGFYKHIETNQRYYIDNFHDGYDISAWQLTDYVENTYNKLILFNGKLFHKATGYFGNTKETARLFQTFFFNTEY